MTWLNFISYLGMGYALYYGTLVLMENRASPGKGPFDSPVLTFGDTAEPQKVSLEDFGYASLSGSAALGSSAPASMGLGGVSIKDLFELARKDAIEFTRSVSF